MSVQESTSRALSRSTRSISRSCRGRAQERYEEFAHQMTSHDSPAPPGSSRLMAANEAKHGASWRNGATRCSATRRVPSRGMLWDVEAPDYDEARAFMSAHDAMRTALRSERRTRSSSTRCRGSPTRASSKRLFTELCAGEIVHGTW